MNENVDNNDWKMEAPTLAAMAKRNPFVVPNGYFESVEEGIFSNIFLDNLKEKTVKQSFEVPQNYFEELTAQIETKISFVEIQKTENTFVVPANYFETLQSRITNKIAADEPKKVAKIIPLWRRDILKYASAACFVIMASFGAYFYQNEKSIPVAQTTTAELTANEQLLYDIDESEIIDHLATENALSSKTNSSASYDAEMENYILSNFSSSDLTHELN